MTCAEARRLLDQGIIPGSARGRDPQLGFHLAGCAECRAYREQLNQRLLTELIATPTVTTIKLPPEIPGAVPLREPQVQSTTPQLTKSAVAPSNMPRRQSYRTALLLTILGCLTGFLGFSIWYVGLPMYRAYNRDIKSWNVVAATSLNRFSGSAISAATATPTLQPTATALPSMTPLPTATATPTTTPTITPTPTPALPAARPMTVLLLGIDARPGEGTRARSDALMLARIDPQRGETALLSMPRDLWLNIPGYGEGKVNNAFYQGELAQPGGGIALAKQTLQDAYSLPIDHAVVIDFAGFRSLIDALGGITVDVPKELYDGRFPTDDYGYTVAHFLPGPQQMDGATALIFARTRHPDSDFERIKRQQLVLLGIAQKIKERGALQNLHEADQLTAALTPYIQTDMPPQLVLSMLWSIREIDPATVRRYTVDVSMVWETSVNGAYALVPQQGVLSALGQKLLAPSTP